MSAQQDPLQWDAAVVIVNYRTPELVERCVASLHSSCADLSLDLVIVDNDSQDGSVERLRDSVPEGRVIQMSENRGFAAGVNAGFAHTEAAVVIVLNPDTEVRADALQLLIGRLARHPRTGVAAPLLEGPGGELTPSGYRRFPNLLMLGIDMCVPIAYALELAPAMHPHVLSPRELVVGGRVAHVCGAAMAIRRRAYDEAGPFDEGFFLYLEETEWQGRVAERGWDIELEPQARVCHLVRGGGDAALAPSEHGVTSTLRYLQMQGVPMAASRAMLALALGSSWLTLRLISLLPSKRGKATSQARAYRSLLRALR